MIIIVDIIVIIAPSGLGRDIQASRGDRESADRKPSLPTKIIPTKIVWLKTSGKFPKGLGIHPLNINIVLESIPPNSRILVRKLAVV